MKNIFDQSTRDELLLRVDKLTPDTKALWGKMNVNQALRHMTCSFQIAEGEMKISGIRIPVLKSVFRFFLVNFKPAFHGTPTAPEVDMVKNKINPPDFFAEQKSLREAIAHFGEKPLIAKNVQGIPMSKTDWGKVNYIHTDHHLRQFGV